ncbi:MAG: hypothetical protein ABNH21_14190 [Glaciecola sp.]|jgi:hypothetical protein
MKMQKANKQVKKQFEVVLEADINAFARIVDLLTMLSLTPSELILGSTQNGNYLLTIFLNVCNEDLVFYSRFRQKLRALEFVYELSNDENKND